MKYFTDAEFACKHCGCLPDGGMNAVLLEKLDQLRERIGAPIIAVSYTHLTLPTIRLV